LKPVILTHLKGLAFPVKVEPFQVTRHMYVSNDTTLLEELDEPSVVRAMGELEVNALRTCQAFAFSPESDMTPDEALRVLASRMLEIQALLVALWLIHDNSIDTEMVFAIHEYAGTWAASSNFIGTIVHMADGTNRTVMLDPAWTKRIIPATAELENLSSLAPKASSGTSHEHPRLVRCLYFVQMARTQGDLALKIAIYCSALEALLLTSSGELSHQLAERAAILVQGDKMDRVDIFETVKRAYGVRSKILHGAGIKEKDRPKLPGLATGIDEILRVAVLRAMFDKEYSGVSRGNAESIDRYFVEKLLGSRAH
jgi:hypothetical protein